MSDETRTVTVEALAAAMWEVRIDHPKGFITHEDRAAAIFAALPVATAGPEPTVVAERLGWLADRLVMVYGESENTDYILHTRSMSAALRGAAAQADGVDDGVGLSPVDALRSIAQHSGDPGSRWVAEKALARVAQSGPVRCTWCLGDGQGGHALDCARRESYPGGDTK